LGRAVPLGKTALAFGDRTVNRGRLRGEAKERGRGSFGPLGDLGGSRNRAPRERFFSGIGGFGGCGRMGAGPPPGGGPG